MASKIKADQFETLDGNGNITLNNSVTMASTKTLPAASLTGTVPTASLGSGTASSSVFLRGDGSWQAAGSTSASDLTSGTLPIARIADDAVTLAKMADDAIGVAQLSATGTASSSTFLRGDNAWVAAGSPSISDGGNSTAITIDSSENVGIGKTSALGATLHIDPAADVTTGYGTPLVKVGGDNSWTALGLFSIGFGYTNGATVKSPAEIGLKTTSSGGVTKGSLVFATRDVVTDTAPTERLAITSDGRGLSQFTAKAWAKINGTGTIAFHDSHNCSSLSDSGTGRYTVNWTNNLGNANYACVANCPPDNNSGAYGGTNSTVVGSASIDFRTAAGSYHDVNHIAVLAFGDNL